MLRPPLRLHGRGAEGRRATRSTRLVALAAVLQLTAGVAAAAVLDGPPPALRTEARSALAAPPPLHADPPSPEWRTARETAVRDLLATRSAAVLARDEQAFLSVIDPTADELRARGRALFAALEQVPLSTWRYVLDPAREQPDADLDRRYGPNGWWAPGVTLEHALDGFDHRPVADAQHLTFVHRDGRWWLGGDGSTPAGRYAPTGLWDQGPVVAERERGVLVLGRPADRQLLRDLAVLTAEAVPRVAGVWGSDWSRRAVVLVPGSGAELQDLLGADGDLTRIAAVATADLVAGADGVDAVGDRVVVNREAFSRLGQVGRRLVLTHEVTHVATRRATGPAVPRWLAEGFADHVGYTGADVPLSVSARSLRADVRAGRLPERLPGDSDFDGGNPALAQAYEQSWLAVRMIADRHGEAALHRFYRAVGARRGVEPDVAVDDALRSELGTTTAQLTADWRATLQRDLG